MQQTTTQHTATQATVDRQDKPYLVVHKVLDFILTLIQGVLVIDFVLLLSGANRATGFFQFIHGIASVLMAPFRFILPASNTGDMVLDWSILVAMLVYGLLFIAIRQAVGVIYTADRA